MNLYTDVYLFCLDGFFFESKDNWSDSEVTIYQDNAVYAIVKEKTLPQNKKIAKDLSDSSINIHKIEIIFLAFQTWAPA